MARPREFDIDTAVEDAMNVFWERGYLGTSIPDLLAGMGITRGSLYKAFGSKKALFLHALALYDRRHVQPAIALLRQYDGNGTDRIRRVFESVAGVIGRGDRRGCLLCNTAAGPAFDDADITSVINRMIDGMTDAFRAALSDHPSGMAAPADGDAFARQLTLIYVGMRVLTRSGSDVDWLTSGALQSLDMA